MSFHERGSTGEVDLYGQAGKVNGVVMELPDSLSEASLAIIGLKLQIAQSKTITEASWKDVVTTLIALNSVPSQPHEIQHGVILTVDPNKNAKTQILLRLVPIKDENLIAPTGATPTTYSGYEQAAHIRLTDSGAHNHDIDTSKLPIVIQVNINNLKSLITLTGDTHDIVISGETAVNSAIDAANSGITSASNAIDILYSIGTLNGKKEI